jgi:hypothetical protein
VQDRLAVSGVDHPMLTCFSSVKVCCAMMLGVQPHDVAVWLVWCCQHQQRIGSRYPLAKHVATVVHTFPSWASSRYFGSATVAEGYEQSAILSRKLIWKLIWFKTIVRGPLMVYDNHKAPTIQQATAAKLLPIMLNKHA